MATQGPSLYDEFRGKIGKGLELPSIGKKSLHRLSRETARELNVSNCWVCRVTLMSEEWPWKGSTLNAY
jgi:hypothetical protein